MTPQHNALPGGWRAWRRNPAGLSWFAQALLLAVILSPTLAYVAVGEFDALAERLVALAGGILGTLVLLCGLLLHWRTGWFLTFALAFVGVLDLAYIIKFGWPLDANALALIGESNLSDAMEMVAGVPVLAFVPLMVVLSLSLASWQKPRRLPGRRHALRMLAYPLLGIVLTYATVHASSAFDPGNGEVQAFPPQAAGQARAWRGAYPTGFLWVIGDLVVEQRALALAQARNAGYAFGATADDHGARRVHVLVIGEASRGDHWQLNGYARETTPMLAARGDVVSFRRMFSPWAFSRLAVPLLITRKPETSTHALFDEASLVTAFAEAGYRTAWISLKPSIGFHASPVSVHAQEADEVLYLNTTDKGSNVKNDLSALPAFREVLAEDGRDLFVVLHTIGSHFDYSRRYEAAQAEFLPDNPPDGRLKLFDREHAQYLVNAYDNSIRVTDRLLASLIEILEAEVDTEAWIYYSSDHGEGLFDGCGASGHGQVSFETQSVAAVFWASESYARHHGPGIAALRSHIDFPLSIGMTFETLSDLGGLRVPGRREGLSFASRGTLPSRTALAAEQRRVACKAGR